MRNPLSSLLNKESREAARDEAFANGKTISDFVGMFVRLVFLLVACSYFIEQGKTSEGIWSFVFGASVVSTATLATLLCIWILRIILCWELRDLNNLHPVAGTVLAIFSLVMVCSTGTGLALFALDLAETAAIAAKE